MTLWRRENPEKACSSLLDYPNETRTSRHIHRFITNPLLMLPILLIGLSIYVRLRYLDIPLERDEGEYAYMGQLLLEGVSPYQLAYTMKLPGVAMMYAFFMSILGQTVFAIHFGLLIINLLTTVLVYLIGQALYSRDTAAVAAGYYALLSLSANVMGFAAHATHFVNLFLLAGLLLMLMAKKKGKLPVTFASGLCFGLAILMKQHAVIMLPFAGFPLASAALSSRRKALLAALFTGAAMPYVLICLWMLSTGLFDRFWLWTVQYASTYASGVTVDSLFSELIPQVRLILGNQLLIWLLAVAGAISLASRGPRESSDWLIIPAYLLLSFVMICPGFTFRNHYFLLMLPPVALLAAYITTHISAYYRNRRSSTLPVIVMALAALQLVISEKSYLFTNSPEVTSRIVYGANPFPESIIIGEYLNRNSSANDRIVIFGSEPQIYFYAGRRSATGHIYMYGLTEEHGYAKRMQAELIAEVEAAKPLYVIVVHNPASWLINSASAKNIFEWGDTYIPLNYDKVGIIDTYYGNTRYLWGEEIKNRDLESEYYVVVYRRKL